ncbi:MAG: hypothetical protein JSV52_14565 [Candidatus Zixiibacteriota bacterium]|nr:MAG: hypothetical protein JSV52_14565 [candidate division Zixibacteria bacterium]
MRFRTGILNCAIVTALTLLCGCGSVSTKRKFYEPITAELHSGKPGSSAAMLERAREEDEYGEKDRLVYFLDAGLLNHYADSYQVSIDKLQLAEAAAEELFTKSISKAALSLLLNDNVLDYSGEDYEILYANLINALNYIHQDRFDDAFVEIRRANLKLDLLEQKYGDAAAEFQRGLEQDTHQVNITFEAEKVRFQNDAFARYLSMHMYAADGKMDDARIDHEYLTKAFQTQPHIYDFPMPEVKYYSEDKSVLSIVGLAGLCPIKEPLRLRIRTDKQLNLVQVLYDGPEKEDVEYGHLPMRVSEDYYFKFAIPVLVQRPSRVGRIKVLVNGESIGQLQLLEDIGKVAEETFSAKKSLIYLRSLARAVVKGLAAHRMKEKNDDGNFGGWLKKVAIDVATDITEDADLRCGHFLPGMIYVGDFEIEPGTYDITIEFYDTYGNFIERTDYEAYQLQERGLNMLRAYSVK